MEKKSYSELLRDPLWQKKRLKILERDNFTCQNCSDTKNELHIHHFKYYGKPWEAEDNDLITYCKECHEFITRYNGSIKEYLSEISKIYPHSVMLKICHIMWCLSYGDRSEEEIELISKLFGQINDDDRQYLKERFPDEG